MKLVTFRRTKDGAEELGLLRPDETVLPLRELGYAWPTMNDLIRCVSEAELSALVRVEGTGLPLAEVTLLAPIPCPMQDILCLGLNYTEHAEEAHGYSSEAFTAEKAYPVFFSKRANYCQGSGAPIQAHADLTEKLDYENELAVILGKDAKDVPEDEAEQYIFGYTIVNDVSARDLQTRHKQWYFGKSLDGFSPMGPCIVTADEIPYPPALDVRTTVNGELRQNSNTRMLIHGISEIISVLSKGMELKAGTIIATGTPKGVIMGMEQPQFLKKGDRIVCSIEGIGDLENTVL